jgi:D-3-phosphoglycerate dehydrogenase
MPEASRILLLEGVHPVARAELEGRGYRVELRDSALGEDELIAALAGVSVVGIRSKTQLTRRVLEAAPHLLCVGAFCIGTNQIDLGCAQELGIPAFNAPFSNTRSVAELVIAEVVALSRRLGDHLQRMHKGSWHKTAKGAREVRGKTLGIVGYGHIGRQVGVLAEALGLRVLFYDIVTQLPMGNNRQVDTLSDLLSASDFVTLHVPETPETTNMIGRGELARMRAGSFLINASRGTVVDISALAEALRSGHLAGAAVDVFPVEPKESASEDFRSELCGLPNVILTPHIGGSTLEAQEAIGREVSACLVRFCETGATSRAVNFPSLELFQTPSAQRIAHVHRNVPGVLSDVNHVVSRHRANIQAQLLGTTGGIGYLLMDVDREADAICREIAALDTTLRVRRI